MLRLAYYPALALGQLLGISKSSLQRRFIQWNNHLLKPGEGYRPDKVLVLLPHCLQISQCEVRITHNPAACKRCGRCDIGTITAMCETAGTHLGIAPGGTIARRLILNLKPEMVIAVACERDLLSGIHESHPLPVFGILNERPNGPCLDTGVSSENLGQALRRFIKPA